MKSFLIIGLGRFGSHLCQSFSKLGHEVVIVDKNEELLEPLLPFAADAKIGDCTKEIVLRSLGVGNFDKCFVCIGSNFQSSLEITCLLKELGAKYVVSKASRDIHAKFLLRNGADEIVYPEREMAEKSAVKYSSDSVFDYFDLSDGFSMYEVAPMPAWIGKSIVEVNVRQKYRINIAAIQTQDGTVSMPDAGYIFREEDHLMAIGRNEDLRKLMRRYKD